MKTLRTLAALVGLLLYPSCVAPVAQQTQPYDDAPFARYDASGNCAIAGQAFLKTMGGDVKVGAGEVVELIPVTNYTAERFSLANEHRTLPPRDPRMARHVRRTICDAQGNFEFRGIPAGGYYLVTTIQWRVSEWQWTGGQIVIPVAVSEGETKRAMLTR